MENEAHIVNTKTQLIIHSLGLYLGFPQYYDKRRKRLYKHSSKYCLTYIL